MIFVDTSFLFALTAENDPHHTEAKELFDRAIKENEEFVIHNYIIVECFALLDRRIGRSGSLELLKNLPKFKVSWIKHEEHILAEIEFKEARSKRLSFVDIVSFQFMRSLEIRDYLGFDSDFEKEGFRLFGQKSHH